jgi:steroid delta-isomerase-like uncharacterized protein
MTVEEIREAFARRQEAINNRDLTALAALYALDCSVESPLAAGTVQGRQAVTKIHQALFDALPDLHFGQERILIDGNEAVQIATLTGTYTGGFMGLPPSGKTLKVPIVVICTFEDGLIAQERRIYDFTGMLVQIGVLKARPA